MDNVSAIYPWILSLIILYTMPCPCPTSPPLPAIATMGDRDGNQTDMPSLMGNLQLSDNEMVVDDYDQYGNDRSDVVVVSPPGSASEPEPEPLANDCMSLSSLPPSLPRSPSPLSACLFSALAIQIINIPRLLHTLLYRSRCPA